MHTSAAIIIQKNWRGYACREMVLRAKGWEAPSLVKMREKKKSAKLQLRQGSLRIEEVLDVYELLTKLGEGNYACVWKARERRTNAVFAMKVVDKNKLKSHLEREMLQVEILLLKQLDHPNLIKCYNVMETYTQFYIALTLFDGEDLFSAVSQSGSFTEADARNILKQTLIALKYLHGLNIAHRDIKPENILVDKAFSKISLCDFGLAKVMTTELEVIICGTPSYMAPEVVALSFNECAPGYGKEVDMWALGVVLYISLCGYPPFVSIHRDEIELFQKILAAAYSFHVDHWTGVSDAAKDMINMLLSVDIKARLCPDRALKHPWMKVPQIVINSNRRLSMRDIANTAIVTENHFPDAPVAHHFLKAPSSVVEGEANVALNARPGTPTYGRLGQSPLTFTRPISAKDKFSVRVRKLQSDSSK